MKKQSCGNCRHFKPMPKPDRDWGECLWTTQIPFWIADGDRVDSVSRDDGKTCRAWLVIPKLEGSVLPALPGEAG